MKLHVLRERSTKDGTPGSLTVLETAFACCDLELPWANNLSGTSCVMPGTYACDVWFSPHLNRNVLRLEDRNGRKDCLVHNGNFAGSVADGDITQVHGCTEVGSGFGQIQKPNSTDTQFGIMNSGATLDRLLRNIGPGPHSITYEWAPGCAPDDLRDLNPLSKGAQ